MMLSKIIKNLNAIKISGKPDIKIDNIYYDSRKAGQNSLFVCITGFSVDGHKYVTDAVNRGAVAVIAEKELQLPENITSIYVKDSREALASVANEFYDCPSQKLKLIGITGTNGKTTTTYLIRAILNKNGEKCGLIGTINNEIDSEKVKSKNTTPESLDLQEMLHKMVIKKIDSCVMEVSSHSLAMHRVEHCEFDIAIFTNLTLDHLDYHKTFEDYLKAKLKLFQGLGSVSTKTVNKFGVVNLDDEKAADFINATRVNKLTYGLNKNADVRAENISSTVEGLSFNIIYKNESVPVKLKMRGSHNIYNALAAASVGIALDIDSRIIKAGLEEISSVPGRFDLFNAAPGFSLVVDYAHTPDALMRLLKSIRELKPKRIISVFGCGGDRDRSKRPIMGKISSELADYTIITSDNPRSEDPIAIIDEVKKGIAGNTYKAIPDRREAILEAIKMAKPGDVIAVAGKGHEDYQIIGKETIHFSDKEVIEEALRSRGIWKES